MSGPDSKKVSRKHSVGCENIYLMDSVKKSLIPFVPPPLRGLTCKSLFNLFDAIVAVLNLFLRNSFRPQAPVVSLLSLVGIVDGCDPPF